MPLKDPKPRVVFLLKTEKGKWLAFCDNNNFNSYGTTLVLDKSRAYRFVDRERAEYWVYHVAKNFNADASVVEENT